MRKKSSYILAIAILLFTILLNAGSYTGQELEKYTCDTSDTDKMKTDTREHGDINQKTDSYQVNNIFNSVSGDIYRLTFSHQTNRDVSLGISAIGPSSRRQFIRELELSKSESFMPQEIFFETKDRYSDIIFKKAGQQDNAEILIKDVRVVPLILR